MSDTDEIAVVNFCARTGNTGVSGNENGIVFDMVNASNYEFELITGSLPGGPVTLSTPVDITIAGDRVTIPLSLVTVAAMAAHDGPVTYEIRRSLNGQTYRSFFVGTIDVSEGLF